MRVALLFFCFLIFGFCISGCVGGSGGSADSDTLQRDYQFNADQVIVRETDNGRYLDLIGVAEEAEFTTTDVLGAPYATGSFSSHDFIKWYLHPAAGEHQFRELTEVQVSDQNGSESYDIATPLEVSYDEATRTHSYRLAPAANTLSRAEGSVNIRQNFGYSTIRFKGFSSAHPVECNQAVPSEIPGLTFFVPTNFENIWDDRGTGSDRDVRVWRAQEENGFKRLGDVAIGRYGSPWDVGCYPLLVKETDPNAGLIAKVSSYQLVWADHGSGADRDGSFWAPNAPAGYTCVGAVIQKEYEEPEAGTSVCLRSDLVAATGSTGVKFIWSDRGSGARTDVALYSAGVEFGTFFAEDNYSGPVGNGWELVGK